MKVIDMKEVKDGDTLPLQYIPKGIEQIVYVKDIDEFESITANDESGDITYINGNIIIAEREYRNYVLFIIEQTF